MNAFSQIFREASVNIQNTPTVQITNEAATFFPMGGKNMKKGKRSRFDGILSPFPKLPCPLQGENDYRLPPFQPQKPISSYVT